MYNGFRNASIKVNVCNKVRKLYIMIRQALMQIQRKMSDKKYELEQELNWKGDRDIMYH